MTRRPAAERPDQNSARQVAAMRAGAVLVFLVSSLIAVVWGRGERSGFISMGQPGAWDFSESLLGYCFFHGDEPFMKENIPHVTQVAMFKGSREARSLCEFPQESRFWRGLYSFLASLLTPPLDVVSAMLAVNWLSWALCTWTAWRLTRDAFHSEAAATLAAVLISGGIGMTAHVHDYSPHLLAFASYFLGVWLLYRSRVWRRRRPWRIHLRLGLYLAVACLAYNTGVMLTAAYVLTSLRRNRPAVVIPTAMFAFAAAPLWRLVLGIAAEDLDAKYLSLAGRAWLALVEADLYSIFRFFVGGLAECVLFFDSPLVVLLGFLACVTAPMSLAKRWFGIAIVGLPILAAWFISPAASARGYIVYGGVIWIVACLGYQAARGWASSRRWLRVATTAAAVVVLAVHFAWSEAHLVRYLGPVKTYFLGIDEGRMYFLPYVAMSLTGREPTPVLFGGVASLKEAGAYIASDEHVLNADQVSLAAALTSGWFFFVAIGLLLAVGARKPRQRVNWLAAWSCLYLASCLWGELTFRSLPAFFPVSRAIVLQPGEQVRLEVELSPQFASAMRSAREAGDQFAFYASQQESQRGLELTFFAGGLPLEVSRRDFHLLYVDTPEATDALLRNSQFSMVATNTGDQACELAAWQRAGLPGRILVNETDSVPAVLPICELRLYSSRGRLKLAGF